MVVFFHATGDFLENFNHVYLYKIFDQGFSGVDFFFILSGFIIFYVHQSDIGKKDKFNIFITKRFIRVYPLHWIATTLMFITFVTLGYGEGLVRDSTVILKSFFLIPQTTPINGVIWTLSHEILFYLLFSTLIVFSKRVSYPLLITWFTITLVTYLGVLKVDNFIFNFFFSKYNIEFALGSLTAFIIINYNLKYSKAIMITGILLTVVSWSLFDLQLSSIYTIIAYGVPYTLIILGAASIAYQKDVSMPKILTLLGDASYSIYLTHLLFLNGLIKVFGMLQIPDKVGYSITMNAIVLLTIIMSCVFYLLVEKPMLKGIKFKIKKRKEVVVVP